MLTEHTIVQRNPRRIDDGFGLAFRCVEAAAKMNQRGERVHQSGAVLENEKPFVLIGAHDIRGADMVSDRMRP